MVHCTQCQIPEDGIPRGHNTSDFNRYFCLSFINPNILWFPHLHESVTVLFVLQAVRRFILSFLLCKFEFMHVFFIVVLCMLFQSFLYCSKSCTSLHSKILKSHTEMLKMYYLRVTALFYD
jgi:hypothetical protein